MDDLEYGTRDKRGNWTPNKPLEIAPFWTGQFGKLGRWIVGYLSRLRAYANVNPGRDKLRRLGLRRVVAYELLKPANKKLSGVPTERTE